MKLPLPALLLAILAGFWPGGRVVAAPRPAPSSQRIQLLLNTDNAAATRQSRQLLAHARRQGPPAALAESYWLLGSALRDQGRFDSSLYYGQRALTLAARHSYREGAANAYTLLAQTYKRLGDAQHVPALTRQALGLAGQAVAVARQQVPPLVLSRAYILQGIIYRDLKRYDSARVCYQRAILLAQQNPGLPSPLPVGYADLGQLLMDADHNLPLAIDYFRRALPLYRREGNHNGLEHAYRNLSWAYRQQGRLAPACQTADTCLALGRASGDPHRLQNSLQAAYLAYRAAGQLPQAITLLEEWKNVSETLARLDLVRAVAASQATYELAQQTARINRLDQTNTRQERLLWVLGLGAALLLILLGVVGWQYRLIRRTVARLHATNLTVRDNNQHIAEQSDRLATLLREVHHRVKNNLAIVASLLRLQANRLPDPEAARAVRESQQRIEAMSLLHQGLYQTDDVTAVDMRRYVADLVQSLSAAYNYTTADFDLTLDVAALQLDVDVAVPLGLLLNELLTNAFKHVIGPPGSARVALRVTISPTPDAGLLLEVQDNGPGFDPDAVRHSGSFGQRLITALTGQLGGKLDLEVSNGTHYRLTLPAPDGAAHR
ncbi:MAG: sensor histidine kinase [Janthinobacterium lividum]